MGDKDMKYSHLVKLIFGLFIFNMFGVSQAALLTINNASFEDDLVNPGGWNYDVGSWDESIVSGAGTWEPATGYFDSIPDGDQVAYINNGFLTQSLSDVLTANTQYTLDVDIGWRDHYSSSPDFIVELLAGNNVLAFDNSTLLNKGSWETSTLSYFASSSDAYLGQNLGIRLTKTGSNQTNFDNVRIDAASVPEPSILALMGLGIFGLGLSRRKMKK